MFMNINSSICTRSALQWSSAIFSRALQYLFDSTQMTLVGEVRFSFSSHCLHSFEACHQNLYLSYQYLLVNIISPKVIIKSSALGKKSWIQTTEGSGRGQGGGGFRSPRQQLPWGTQGCKPGTVADPRPPPQVPALCVSWGRSRGSSRVALFLNWIQSRPSLHFYNCLNTSRSYTGHTNKGR